jgi:LuxR family maltose regulon positive regulatory protein
MTNAGLENLDCEEQANLITPEPKDPLLQTKLFIPQVQSGLVTRSRLFEQLNCGLKNPLILITAPAGYGKTTLVSSWLQQSKILSSWISLDEDDNDPIRFLQYFIIALQNIVPGIQLNLLGALQGRQQAHYNSLINFLINEITSQTSSFVLVLDDFHVIQSQSVLDMFIHLLEHLPPQMHMVLLSRSDPLLPLSRLRVRKQMTEIRTEQLRFTADEIVKFLNDMLALDLSSDDIAAMEERTEGWIASLQLAAISMLAGKDVHGFVAAFTGSHHYIMDYLTEEVLKLQPETVRSFLLFSSILDRMCGPLCDVLVETPQIEIGHGQAMLEALEKSNLFIIPLDGERRWYRYHHLFADVLNRRLEILNPQLLPELHRRASQWYERNGYIFDAIHHILLAGDREHAAQLLDNHGCLLLMRGEVVTLLHWIEAVEPYSQTFAWIAIQKAWALCLTGQLSRAEQPLQAAAQLISVLPPSDNKGTMLGAVSAAQAFRANLLGEARLAADYARQALDFLPASNDFSCSLRSAATSILGDACWLEGNLLEAQSTYTTAMQISQGAGNIHMTIIAICNLADVLLEGGRLKQANALFSEALKLARLPDGQISPLIDHVYAGLSRGSYEGNDLEEAKKYAELCIDCSQRWGNSESLAFGLVILASIEHSQGNPEKSKRTGRVLEQLLREITLPTWKTIAINTAFARLLIIQGELERASDLVEKSNVSLDGEISYRQEPFYLLRLRLYQAQGEYDAVLTLSERLLKKQNEYKHTGHRIETLILRALAFQAKKEVDPALEALSQVFSLARPEGYRRVFLDEGEPMAKLLYQAKTHQLETGYVMDLLSAMGAPTDGVLPPAKLLIEPLTLREMEILKLIEAGCSNQEIAEKYVISVPTVKRHISNIYMKLGVSSRTQAVSCGKELGLFN